MGTLLLLILSCGIAGGGTYVCLQLEKRVETVGQELLVELLGIVFAGGPGIFWVAFAAHPHTTLLAVTSFLAPMVTILATGFFEITANVRENHRQWLQDNGIDIEATLLEIRRLQGPAYLYAPVTRRQVLFPWRSSRTNRA
jgi:hypothetical protein